jgi:hypothetical protein
MSGFDLYHFNRTSPLRTFAIPQTRMYVKQGAFGEGSTIAACGSDHGRVYVFKLGSADILQTLKHCKSKLDNIDQIRGTTDTDCRKYDGPNGRGKSFCVNNAPHAEYALSALPPPIVTSSQVVHLVADSTSVCGRSPCIKDQRVPKHVVEGLPTFLL